jgi:hypothetical protein
LAYLLQDFGKCFLTTFILLLAELEVSTCYLESARVGYNV